MCRTADITFSMHCQPLYLSWIGFWDFVPKSFPVYIWTFLGSFAVDHFAWFAVLVLFYSKIEVQKIRNGRNVVDVKDLGYVLNKIFRKRHCRRLESHFTCPVSCWYPTIYFNLYLRNKRILNVSQRPTPILFFYHSILERIFSMEFRDW